MSGALPNLQARHARIETLEPGECNIVTSRAFASWMILPNSRVAMCATMVPSLR